MTLAQQPAEALRLSYSAVIEWRKCEQSHQYRYVEGLRPKVENAAPHLGRVLHGYLEAYYGMLKRTPKTKPGASHSRALTTMHDTYGYELEQLSNLAAGLSQDELARELRDVVQLAETLAVAYFRVRGREDADRYEFLLVEKKFDVPVREGIILPGRIDLVTRDRGDGTVALWDHKSTRRVPRIARRIADLQTLLYNVALDMKGLHVDRIVWNYIDTNPPHLPKMLQNGTLSRDKRQTMTLEQLERGLSEASLQKSAYDDLVSAVQERERLVMFQRHEMPVLQNEEIVLRDYVRTAEDIALARSDPDFRPVRNIGQQCEWCDFLKLCLPAITGGDPASAQRLHFQTERKEPISGSNEPDPYASLD